MSSRDYVNFDSKKGYPVGADLYYECLLCGDVLASKPADDCSCKCRNIMIDIGYGRFSVRYNSKIRLFRSTCQPDGLVGGS